MGKTSHARVRFVSQDDERDRYAREDVDLSVDVFFVLLIRYASLRLVLSIESWSMRLPIVRSLVIPGVPVAPSLSRRNGRNC